MRCIRLPRSTYTLVYVFFIGSLIGMFGPFFLQEWFGSAARIVGSIAYIGLVPIVLFVLLVTESGQRSGEPSEEVAAHK